MGRGVAITTCVLVVATVATVIAGAETHWFGLMKSTTAPFTAAATLLPTAVATAAPTVAPTAAATVVPSVPVEPGPVVTIPGNNGSISCTGYCNGNWGVRLIPAASYPQYSGAYSTQTLPDSSGNCPCVLTNTSAFAA